MATKVRLAIFDPEHYEEDRMVLGGWDETQVTGEKPHKYKKVYFSSGKDNWETPNDLFERYNSRYSFVLDAAADSKNAKVASYFGPGGLEEDALTADWGPWLQKGNIWLNPPYSRGLQKKFIEKAVNEKAKLDPHHHGLGHVVCLLPARTDTKLFHEIIKPYAADIEFLKGRIKFVGAEHGAPFPSMVVIF